MTKRNIDFDPLTTAFEAAEWMQLAVEAFFENNPGKAREAMKPNKETLVARVMLQGPVLLTVPISRRGGSIQNRRLAAQVRQQETHRNVLLPEEGMELVIYRHPSRGVVGDRIAALLPIQGRPNWQLVYVKGGHCEFRQH